MNPFDLPFALMGFIGFVMLMPAWIWFTTQHPSIDALQIEARFLVQFVLPGTLLLFLASWLQGG